MPSIYAFNFVKGGPNCSFSGKTWAIYKSVVFFQNQACFRR